MLLQSVLTLSAGDGDYTALTSLTTQLAEITATCDKQMLELLRIADQKAQIQQLQDVHVASALAMALRKLNASYAKRTGELRDAREQIEQLKGEVEEAWKAAQDMAQEMDDLDNFHSGFSSDEGGEDDPHMDESVRLAEVIGITGTAVAMKATLTQLAEDKAKEREGSEYSRQRKISAARKRSSRASKASLRLRKPSLKGPSQTPDYLSVTSRTSDGSDRVRAASGSDEPVPPMPRLRVETATATGKGPKGSSFLEMAETRPVSPASPVVPTLPPPPARSPLTSNQDGERSGSQSALIYESHSCSNASRARSGDSLSIQSRHSTFDFEIPPIAIHPADELGAQSTSLSRRVQSMQPSPTVRAPIEDVDGPSLKRTSSEHAPLDGPTRLSKHDRRRSMPLTGLASTEEIHPDMGESLLPEYSRPRSPSSVESSIPFPSPS